MKLTLDLPDDEAAALALLCERIVPAVMDRLGMTVPQSTLALSACVRVRQALETQKQMQEPTNG